MIKNIQWFKDYVAPYLIDFKITYKFFKDGDYGDLDQVEFNSNIMGGEIDFWSSGWLNVHLVNYTKNKELINILLSPDQHIEKDNFLLQIEKTLTYPDGLDNND